MLTEKVSKIFIWIGLAIVIIGIILFFNGEELFQWDKEIKADKVAQLGDFVGGVAGALWALAGVILFYVALEKQKNRCPFKLKSSNYKVKNCEKHGLFLRNKVILRNLCNMKQHFII
ncbi:MAG: hypothetical protein IPQ04_07295 [Saprospiraceae bacterium]|nr:hypothetical protein [Saprospiraceae bacterium]